MSSVLKNKQKTHCLSPIAAAVVFAVSSQAALSAPEIINNSDRTSTLTGSTVAGDTQKITNSGKINVTGSGAEKGIHVQITGDSNITIENTGDINIDASTSTLLSHGILVDGGKVSVTNNADIKAISGGTANSIQAFSYGSGAAGGTTIISHGDLSASDTAIFGRAAGDNSFLSVTTSGKIESGIGNQGLRDALELSGTGANTGIKVDFQGGSIETFNPAGSTAAARGISAVTSGGGSIEIKAKTDATSITTASNSSHGIITSTSALGGDTLIDVDTNITTTGNTSNAIHASSQVGDITILSTGDLNVSGVASSGIHATNQAGDVTITSSSNIKTLGTGSITSIAPGSSSNDEAHGIISTVNGAGNIAINASGSVETHGYDASGVRGYITGSASTGNVTLVYSGPSINTHGNNGDGLYAQTEGSGNISVTATGGTITTLGGGTTTGSAAHGIVAIATSGSSLVDNAATISAGLSSYSHGITARATTGSVKVINTGNISTQGLGSHGIHASATGSNTLEGLLSINSNANIQTSGKGSNAIHATTTGSFASVTTNGQNTAIGEYGSGITAFGGLAGTIINLDPGAITQGGWQADSSSNFGSLMASGLLVSAKGGEISINNNGTLGALSDRAIGTTTTSSAATSTIYNTHELNGFIGLGSSNDTFNNTGAGSTWNVRHFADTDGDGVRDTLRVAVSDFGAGNDTFNNDVLGTVRLAAVNDAATIDTTGQYLSGGLASYDISNKGITQAHLLNLETFNNKGLIDLSANNQAGDTLVITGSGTAGSNGNGMYVSDGGALHMDVFLNKGDASTVSDLMVVDNTSLSGSSTSILMNRVGNKAELTKGDGIKLIEVLGTSQANSFSLSNRALSGPYEYLLYQGAISNPTNQSWYLRNMTPDGKPIYRAEVGSYIGNQTAAIGMFMHTLHDRIGEPQFTEANKTDGNTPSVWIRAVTNKTDSKAGSGTLDQSTDTNLVHLGGELATWQNDTNRLHFGLMGGYGQSKTDTTANPTGRSSEGKVDGYSFGAYATWYGNKDLPNGPYVDGWLQYGSFKNKVNAPDTASEEYDSNVFTASIEAGYAFIMKDAETRQWMFEPQLQLAYNQYKADDHTDATGMRIDGSDADGLITRLGARAYSRTKVGNGIQPFVEANWWHSDANNSLNFDGVSISDDTPSDRFELKLGLQGEVAKDWQLWGHVGAQTGKDNYSRYEGMVGLKHIF